MPIRLDEHERNVELTPGTPKSDIVAFLYDNLELGFKPGEIEDHLDIPYGTVTTILTRLRDDGLIAKTTDGHYHAHTYREDLRRYVSSLTQLETMFEDKDYEEHTDIDSRSVEDIAEAELEVELDELLDEITEE